jgi:hypothetical protein
VAAILESLISLKINRHKMSQKSTSKWSRDKLMFYFLVK